MSVTHPNVARSAATDAVVALLGGQARLCFRLAGSVQAPGAVVASLPMAVLPFRPAAAGVAQANPIASDANAVGHESPVASATLETGGGFIVIHCEVAKSGKDMDMTGGLVIAPGDTIACVELSYAALPK